MKAPGVPGPLAMQVRRLAENNAWSNLRLHAACARLDDDEFAAARTGFFPSLQKTLNHILLVDLYYLAFLLRRPGPDLSDEVPHSRLADLTAAQMAADREIVALCAGLDDAGLQVRVTVARDDSSDAERVGDLLMHLFLHQVHHRGQAHAMLSGSAVPPPQLDEFLLDYDLARRRSDQPALDRWLGRHPADAEITGGR
ncbi:DinB family protein [Marinibaculum pumilum]|uniref:DinB family protein n=1 Tax=Marinibaculum pumilum TaxID=1766165 RepID=A0ABV7L2G9_9PROT